GRVLDQAVAFGLDLGQPHLRVAFGLLREAALLGRDPAVRAGADARVFAIAPVDQIVAALLAGAGVVGDFVSRQAARLGQLARRAEHRETQLLVGKRKLARVAQ